MDGQEKALPAFFIEVYFEDILVGLEEGLADAIQGDKSLGRGADRIAELDFHIGVAGLDQGGSEYLEFPLGRDGDLRPIVDPESGAGVREVDF